MSFRTKIDYSDNRQITQREQTSTDLKGATIFGLPFSGLTSGVDSSSTGITESYNNVTGNTFSGNSTTTVFTWYDSRMNLVDSELSAITPSNSATTQTGMVFAPSSSTVIDGNTVNLTYSGVSLGLIDVVSMEEISPSIYTGVTVVTNFEVINGDSLDFTGRTIWVDCTEIARTKKLIISKNPQPGFVWTCTDTEGGGHWGPSSAVISSADTFTTGATLVGDTVQFDTTATLNAYSVDLSPILTDDNFYTTGSTLIGNTIYYDRTDSLSAYTTDLTDFSFSGGSGNCITDLFVTNMYGCSPITVHDNLILLSGLTFSGDFVPDSDGSGNIGTPAKRFREVNTISGTSSYWTSTTVSATTINLGLDTEGNPRILNADSSILNNDCLEGGIY